MNHDTQIENNNYHSMRVIGSNQLLSTNSSYKSKVNTCVGPPLGDEPSQQPSEYIQTTESDKYNRNSMTFNSIRA